MKKIMPVLGVILTLAAFASVILGLQGYVATAEEVREVSEKMDRHLLEERRDAVQERLWDLEDRWTERYYKAHEEYPDSIEELLAFMTEDAREMHRELTRELEEIEEELDQ